MVVLARLTANRANGGRKGKEIYGDAMDSEKKVRENGEEANMGMEMMMLLETPSDFEVGKREEEARQGRAMDK